MNFIVHSDFIREVEREMLRENLKRAERLFAPYLEQERRRFAALPWYRRRGILLARWWSRTVDRLRHSVCCSRCRDED